MEKILALIAADTEQATTGQTLAAAQHLATELADAPWSVGLWGKGATSLGQSITGYGAQSITTLTDAAFHQSRYSTDALAAESLCRHLEPTVIIAVGTPRMARCLPGVAHRLSGKIDTHITEMMATDAGLTSTRGCYRQRLVASLSRNIRPWFCVLEPEPHDPTPAETNDTPIGDIQFPANPIAPRTEVQGVSKGPSQTQTVVPDAPLLFVAGAGWTKKQPDGQLHVQEAEQAILGFLRRAKASLGSSKSLVDMNADGQTVLPFMGHLNQIGQTGATPRHKKGLSSCCHGEEPHVVGWRFIDERRAINLNENCGWAHGKADVLYVADAFALVPKITALLKGD